MNWSHHSKKRTASNNALVITRNISAAIESSIRGHATP